MRSRSGTIANSHAKVFDTPAPPSPTPGAWSRQQNENSVQYVFYLSFVRTQAKFGIKNWNWHGNRNLMIFYFLTFGKKLTPWAPQCPKVPPLGHDQGDRMKILSMFGVNSFEIDMLTKIQWYLTLWPHPKVTSSTLGWKFYLHSVLLVIPVNLICHMTMFEKKIFLTPSAHSAPQSPTPGAWFRWQN